MSYAFHDIKHIDQPYLDDFPAHSKLRQDHLTHLREFFLHCHHYKIHFNPQKFVFCVESGQLLGFIMSKEDIRLDPLKVELILNLSPPSTLHQIQSLQGNTNFLCRFIAKYVELTKGFTHLLNKDTSFIWDDVAQRAFDALKYTLTHASLLHPPNYHRDYLLYLVSTDSSIAMVLVHEDESHEEHVIYYLSRGLTITEINYAHMEKLALEVVQGVQCFCQYILLHKTTMIFYCNPMQHILTK